MRWDELFADLETQLDAARAAEFDAAVEEASRLETSRLMLMDRVRGHEGRELTLMLQGRQRLDLHIVAVGSDWIAGSHSRFSFLVPQASVLRIEGMQRAAARTETSAARRRLGIAAPLRRLARDRSRVSVYGDEGLLAEGLIATTGRDFLEISHSPAAEQFRDRSGAGSCLTIPLHAVSWFQSQATPDH